MRIIFLLAIISSSAALANRESGGRSGATAVYVNFNSFGNGIDYVTEEFLVQLIGKAKINDLVINQDYKRKGREGEAFYCVQLADSLTRYQFIKTLAPSIVNDMNKTEGMQRTSVYLWEKCGDLKHATEQDVYAYLRN